MKPIRRWGKARFTVHQSDGTTRTTVVRPAPVRRMMQKHSLPEPLARVVAFLAYGEGAHG